MHFKAFAALLLSLIVATLLLAVPVRAEALRIVGLGDSLMAAYQLDKQAGFPARLEAALRERGHDVEIFDAGVSGDTTSAGLARLDWSVPEGTDGVILELGANDALRGVSPAKTRENLEAMIARLKERSIPILLAGMLAPPNMGEAYEEAFNAIYPELAETHGLVFYPFFLDGVAANQALLLDDKMHPNPEGIDEMVARFLPVAEAFLATLERERSPGE